MKKITLLALFTLCAFSSCQKDLYDPEQAKKNEKFTDLVIPQNFDWSMTREVTSQLTSTSDVEVSVYTDKTCTEGSQIAKYTVSPENNIPVIFTLPTALKELYVKQENGQIQTVSIENNAINMNVVPMPSARSITTRDKNNDESEFKSGWYTVMFEDQFPQLGDYDFNDFVANYKYSTTYSQKNDNKHHLIKVDINFKVNAIGGMLPYYPCLRIADISAANDTKTEITIESETENKTVNRLYDEFDHNNKSITLAFDNLTLKPNAQNYVNTFKDKETVKPIEISISIVFNNGKGVDQAAEKLGTLDFEIFLLKKDGVEIHKKGKTALHYTYPNSEIEGGAGNEQYCNDKNYVWMIEVPAKISHVIEKESFLKAYPNFSKWAISGGNDLIDWYKNNVNSEYTIDLSKYNN